MPDSIASVLCLVDNSVQRSSHLWGEHGLAFLIDTGKARVLFDTGQSGTVLMHNMSALSLEPKTIDALAVSHAHYDHTGGLSALLRRARPDLPLYALPDLFRERFSNRRGEPEFIGMRLTREDLARLTTLRLRSDPQEILPGVWTSGVIAKRPEPEGRGEYHVVKTARGWESDPYRDDMAIVVEAGAGLILVCGCCHAGLLNTVLHVERAFGRRVVAIAGGTHLASASEQYLQHVADALVQGGSVQRIYPNHCTGVAAFHTLLRILGPDIVRSCPAGTKLDLEEFL